MDGHRLSQEDRGFLTPVEEELNKKNLFKFKHDMSSNGHSIKVCLCVCEVRGNNINQQIKMKFRGKLGENTTYFEAGLCEKGPYSSIEPNYSWCAWTNSWVCGKSLYPNGARNFLRECLNVIRKLCAGKLEIESKIDEMMKIIRPNMEYQGYYASPASITVQDGGAKKKSGSKTKKRKSKTKSKSKSKVRSNLRK